MAEGEAPAEQPPTHHEAFVAAVDRVANVTPRNHISPEALDGLHDRLAQIMGRQRGDPPARPK